MPDIRAILAFGVDMGDKVEDFLPGTEEYWVEGEYEDYWDYTGYFDDNDILQIVSYGHEIEPFFILALIGTIHTCEYRYWNALPVNLDVPSEMFWQAKMFAERKGIKWENPQWLLAAEVLGD